MNVWILCTVTRTVSNPPVATLTGCIGIIGPKPRVGRYTDPLWCVDHGTVGHTDALIGTRTGRAADVSTHRRSRTAGAGGEVGPDRIGQCANDRGKRVTRWRDVIGNRQREKRITWIARTSVGVTDRIVVGVAYHKGGTGRTYRSGTRMRCASRVQTDNICVNGKAARVIAVGVETRLNGHIRHHTAGSKVGITSAFEDTTLIADRCIV